jgi:hypothetical protein
MPAYKSLDLMDIPRLVPHIWVIDARRGIDDGLMILFSGTDIDLHFGRNLMGSYLTENSRWCCSRVPRMVPMSTSPSA